MATQERKRRVATQTGFQLLQDEEIQSFQAIQCPSCKGAMNQKVYSPSMVTVDCCPNPACGKVWCDGGELEILWAARPLAAAGSV